MDFRVEIEAEVRSIADGLVLLYLPTYSPWLNPGEILWRHYRWERIASYSQVEMPWSRRRMRFLRVTMNYTGACSSVSVLDAVCIKHSQLTTMKPTVLLLFALRCHTTHEQ